MTVVRGSAPVTRQGAAANFTGEVWQDAVVVGQVRYLSGVGRVCIGTDAEPPAIHPGDRLLIPPATMHWHGAAPDRLFAHLAMSESGEHGHGTQWGDYRKEPAPLINCVPPPPGGGQGVEAPDRIFSSPAGADRGQCG